MVDRDRSFAATCICILLALCFRKPLLITYIVCCALFGLLTACRPSSPSDPGNLPFAYHLQNQKTERVLADSNDWVVDNCGGSGDAKRVIGRGRESTVSIELGVELELNIELGVKLRLQAHFGRQEGETLSYSDGVEVNVAPGSSVRYQLQWYETWQTGEMVLGVVGLTIPYRIRTAFDADTKAYSQECPTKTATLATASPTLLWSSTPQETDYPPTFTSIPVTTVIPSFTPTATTSATPTATNTTLPTPTANPTATATASQSPSPRPVTQASSRRYLTRISIPGSSSNGVQFIAEQSGTYEFRYGGGAYSTNSTDLPAWRTAVFAFIGGVQWRSDSGGLQRLNESAMAFRVADPGTFWDEQSAMNAANGRYNTYYLRAGQALVLVAVDHLGFYGDNTGQVELDIYVR